MKKVFIYSNSKETYTFLYSAEWLLGVDIDTIITTDESVFEHIIDNFNFKISHFNSIDECICNCDMIIVYNDQNIPDTVADYIKNISTIQNKTYIKIDSAKNALKKENKFDFSNGNNFDIPAVVIFSLGRTTIPIKTELDINKIFMNEGVTINQFLSPYSNNIVKQFRDKGISRNKVELFNNFKQANVSVYFFDLQNNLNSINKYHNILSNIKPDYILVLTDNDFYDYDELLMYIKCYCFKYPDIIVKSRWLSIGNNMFCHLDNLDNLPQEKHHLVLDFEDKNFYKKLQFDLLSKISLAEGIKRIK